MYDMQLSDSGSSARDSLFVWQDYKYVKIFPLIFPVILPIYNLVNSEETEMVVGSFLKQRLRKCCTDAEIRLRLACYVHLVAMTGFSLLTR